MRNKFIIHYFNGTGGFFLTSVFAKIMGIPNNTVISPVGHCHDLGAGEWTETKDIWVAHEWDHNLGGMKFIYRPGVNLYSTHIIDACWVDNNPDIKVVQISAEPDDYADIVRVCVKKAFSANWSLDEYNKWVRPGYPPYSPNNLAESELICQDLVAGFIPAITKWYDENSSVKYAYKIKFKTVMGLNNNSLVNQVAEITSGTITDEVCEFVQKYQQLNHQLYFV